MRLLVKPIYGWGWYDHQKNSPAVVPAPFETDVVEIIEKGTPFRSALLQAPTGDTPLADTWMTLSPRNTQNDGFFNIRVFSKKPIFQKAWSQDSEEFLLSGFCEVVAIPE